MKRVLAAAAMILAGPTWAQDITREEIRRVDVPGSTTMEVVVMRLTVPVGATIPVHRHNGDEHGVVITASTARAPNGQVIEFPVGATLYFAEGTPHGGLTNIGDVPMVAITTSILRKGKPFSEPVN